MAEDREYLITSNNIKRYVSKFISDLTVTLASASWSGNSITVDVIGITASNNVIVSPSGRESIEAWAEGEVLCSAQGNGTLTFTCTSVPTADINVSVVIVG